MLIIPSDLTTETRLTCQEQECDYAVGVGYDYVDGGGREYGIGRLGNK